ncbi:MAG: hypothetical protein KA203_00005, partial [Aquabacterium sp.]|nr:hypothetical protein [Aquabacterium sp.]
MFADLPSPQALPADVDFLAEFVGPAWLRLSAGPSLKLTALAGWCGKRFADGRAVNLLRPHRSGPLQASLAMQSALAPSSIDGRTTLRLQ